MAKAERVHWTSSSQFRRCRFKISEKRETRGARAVGARGQYESQRQELFVQEEALVKCEFFDFKRVGEEKAKKVFVKQEQGEIEQVFQRLGRSTKF